MINMTVFFFVFLYIPVPDEFVLFIQQSGVDGNITSSRIMMLSLDVADEQIPVPLNIEISAEAVSVAYDHLHHKVCETLTHSLSH